MGKHHVRGMQRVPKVCLYCGKPIKKRCSFKFFLVCGHKVVLCRRCVEFIEEKTHK